MNAARSYPSHLRLVKTPGEPDASAQRPRVLVIEDYPENRRLLSYYLKQEYDVTAVERAEEGLELLKEGNFVLVVMDINLKLGIDGITATKKIRQNPATKHLPVLALTAYALPGDRDRCLNAGCSDYLSKPVFKEVMLSKVKELLDR